MESYQDVKREGTVTLLSWIDWRNLMIPLREHASDVLQVGHCRPQSEAQTGGSTRKRGRDAESLTGARVG